MHFSLERFVMRATSRTVRRIDRSLLGALKLVCLSQPSRDPADVVATVLEGLSAATSLWIKSQKTS